MGKKVTVYIPDEEWSVLERASEKMGIMPAQYLRIVGLMAAKNETVREMESGFQDIYKGFESILLRTQGLASILEIVAFDSASSAAGVRRLLKVEHPGQLQSLKKLSLKRKNQIKRYWKRVKELAP